MENTIGKRIAALRREKGLKQEDVARALDVSSQAVSKLKAMGYTNVKNLGGINAYRGRREV